MAEEDDIKTLMSQTDCSHPKMNHGVCQDCDYAVPQYGSVLDTGMVSTFIKVIFIDESKKITAAAVEPKPDGDIEDNLVQD